jgi:CheY-like chemotaxis protein
MRIFIVENHLDTLKYLQMYLESMGHTVSSGRTIREALQALPKADCDVLISDIALPDGSGWELLRRAELPRPIYAISMSGFGSDADRLSSKAAGYRCHLLKPLLPEQLDSVLDEAARECLT